MKLHTKISDEQIKAFCMRNQIKKMALFGSVLRDDFGAQSDIDVLIAFQPERKIGLIGLSGLEIELGKLLGRNAEIHTWKGLHPGFKDEVLKDAQVIYEQT